MPWPATQCEAGPSNASGLAHNRLEPSEAGAPVTEPDQRTGVLSNLAQVIQVQLGGVENPVSLRLPLPEDRTAAHRPSHPHLHRRAVSEVFPLPQFVRRPRPLV